MASVSEGYPHFLQQFGYSAFHEDTDNVIDLEDCINGATRENGAFHQLGVKYFHDLYFDQIASDDYRELLAVMAEKLDDWVSMEEIRAKLKNMKGTTLNNAIRALKKRNIIIPKAGAKGVYRLPTKAFAVWIKRN